MKLYFVYLIKDFIIPALFFKGKYELYCKFVTYVVLHFKYITIFGFIMQEYGVYSC